MKVISLFSGVGGMDLGFIRAGHRIVWANDIWQDAVETYKKNIGSHVTCSDITHVDLGLIPDADIVIGGFPCQGFSVANMKRHEKDERNFLYMQFLRVLKEKKPAFFIAENVKGILSLGGGSAFQMILTDFASLGYVVRYSVLNAANYGVPQCRERVFLLGVRNSSNIQLSFPPPETHTPLDMAPILRLKPWISIGEALKDIPNPDKPNDLENHEYTKYKLRFNGYLGHRRIDPNLPAPTITARGDHRGGVVVIHHPNNKRRLTARETAIVQSFPLDFSFFGCKTSVYRQVANAVPPLLAQAVASIFPKSIWLKKTHLAEQKEKLELVSK